VDLVSPISMLKMVIAQHRRGSQLLCGYAA
jgi:hypothetical protein